MCVISAGHPSGKIFFGGSVMDLKLLQETPPWEWPEEAGQMLHAILVNAKADPSDRLIATELAGDYTVIDDPLAEALLAIVRDKAQDEELRGSAALSLGPALEHADMMGFEDPEDVLISEAVFLKIQKELRKLYMEPDLPQELRRNILEASVQAPQEWHQEAVRVAYASDDETWRRTAVFCMAFIEGFEQQIIASLDSENEIIQYHAVRAAGNWELEDAWDHVLSLALSDQTERAMRLAAIDAVAGIRPTEASMALTTLMDSDDEEIVEAVFEALTLSGELTEFDDDEDDNMS
jgi:hypothetical protein